MVVEYKRPRHCEGIVESLYLYKQHGLFCDATLVVDDDQIGVHRLVLCHGSPYFTSIFDSRYSDDHISQVLLHNVDLGAVHSVVNFLYTGQIELKESTVLMMFAVVDLFQLTELRELCVDLMESTLDHTNCIDRLRFAEHHDIKRLYAAALRVSKSRFKEVMEEEAYRMLPYDKVHELLASDDLNVDEERVVYESVMKWVNYNPDKRKSYLPNLLSHVRFPLIPAIYLLETVAREKVILEDVVCRQMLDDAKDFHILKGSSGAGTHDTSAPAPRQGVQSGMIYIFGGEGTEHTVDCYNPRTNTWSKRGKMRAPRRESSAVCIGNKIYILGGENDKRGILNSTIIYLIDSDKWVATTKMRYKRSGHGSCIINGQIYVAGGHNGETILNTAEKFEPDTELWMTLAPMNMERCWLGVASTGGHMFAAGGYDGDCVLDSVEVFLPDNNKWSYIAPMCLPRERLGMCAIKGTVYAIGGRRGRAVADCEVYDQRANAWRKISPLLAPRDGMGCVVSDKYIYAIGGFSVKSHSLTVERFVQKKNLWERVCPMTRLHDLAAVVAT